MRSPSRKFKNTISAALLKSFRCYQFIKMSAKSDLCLVRARCSSYVCTYARTELNLRQSTTTIPYAGPAWPSSACSQLYDRPKKETAGTTQHWKPTPRIRANIKFNEKSRDIRLGEVLGRGARQSVQFVKDMKIQDSKQIELGYNKKK